MAQDKFSLGGTGLEAAGAVLSACEMDDHASDEKVYLKMRKVGHQFVDRLCMSACAAANCGIGQKSAKDGCARQRGQKFRAILFR